MLGLLKVVVVMAVMATIGGLAVHWAKDQTSAAIHRTLDAGLPDRLSAHPWAPISHGRPVGSARVQFENGQVTTVRCHATLGTYAVSINHSFSFVGSQTPVRPGCPGRKLAVAMRDAVRADVSTSGRMDTLALTDRQGHRVATLRGLHR